MVRGNEALQVRVIGHGDVFVVRDQPTRTLGAANRPGPLRAEHRVADGKRDARAPPGGRQSGQTRQEPRREPAQNDPHYPVGKADLCVWPGLGDVVEEAGDEKVMRRAFGM